MTITLGRLLERLSDPRASHSAPVKVRVVDHTRNDGLHGSYYAEEYEIEGGFAGWEDGHWSLLAYGRHPVQFLKQLRDANYTRMRRWHPPDSEPWTGADWSNAMCGEAGEAANIVKKLRREETKVPGNHEDRGHLIDMLADELADTMIYMDLLAQHYGIDLQAACADKFNATSVRYGFPERLTDG